MLEVFTDWNTGRSVGSIHGLGHRCERESQEVKE